MFISKNSDETRAFGKALSRQLKSRSVVMLTGAMGNGKSEIARGIARGLNIKGAISSPSFTILNEYNNGLMPLHHFDWYRVESEDELFESGLDEIIGSEGISLIEWHERAESLVPSYHLEIIISKEDEKDTRRIELKTGGGFIIDMEKLNKDFLEELKNEDTCL